jgi:dihydrofolate reductase
MQHGLLDILELSIHPVIVGRGQTFFRAGQSTGLTLTSTKTFSKIVKLTYERRDDPAGH